MNQDLKTEIWKITEKIVSALPLVAGSTIKPATI